MTSFMVFILEVMDELPKTLRCKTPNRGYHYVFKLNEQQMKILTNYKIRQAKLFDSDIDVLYNAGRFMMSGEIDNYDNALGKYVSMYEIIDYTKPAFLPKIIFDEIIKKYPVQKIPVPKILKTMDKLACENEKNDVILKLYLDCLKEERCDVRESWVKIGAIIFNEGGTFKLFDEWSQISKKYELDSCIKLWDSFDTNHNNKVTIGTLKQYAREDKYTQYRKIQERIKNESMKIV